MNVKERLYYLPKTFFKVLSDHGIKHTRKFLSDYIFLRKDIKRRLTHIIKQYKIDNPGIAYQKYLDVDFWVYESLRRVYMLGLNRESPKKRILDLGTGAGYFPFICNYYGHHAEALDVPDNEVYNEITKELGIKRYSQYIHAYKDLVIEKQYDLVTGFMICFNNHKTPKLWHIKEWEYFLKSISKNNLNPKGEVFLSFNSETKEEPVSMELVNYFLNHHAKVKAHEVSLTRESFYSEKTTLEISSFS